MVVVAVLYFTWKAEPLIAYYNRPAFIEGMWRNADGLLALAMVFLIDASDKALIILTIAAPLSVFLGSGEESGKDAFFGLSFLALGPLGWYASREFARAYSRYSSCMDNSIFGFGCNVNGPLLLFLLFSFLLFMSAAAAVLDIVSGVAERMKTAD